MANFSPEELREWVAKQTSYLDPPPDWTPNSASASQRLQTRRRLDRVLPIWPHWRAWLAVAALIPTVIFLIPSGRVAAQQLWQFLTVKQVAFIKVNAWPQGAPSPAVNLRGVVIPPIPARSLDDARARVNYVPRLPRVGILSTAPRLSTTFSLSAGTIVKTADLELALQKAGVTGVSVPPQWNGADLSLHTSAIVIAEWPDLTLVQSLPLTLSAPPGFDFSAYSALILRILGIGPDEAQRLANQMGTAPPWIAPLGRDMFSRATLEAITLDSGPATLVQQEARNGAAPKITIAWSVADRVYLLNGTVSRELAIAAANGVQ